MLDNQANLIKAIDMSKTIETFGESRKTLNARSKKEDLLRSRNIEMITARREYAEQQAQKQFLLIDQTNARETMKSLKNLKIESPRFIVR